MRNNAREYYERSKQASSDPNMVDELEEETMQDYEENISGDQDVGFERAKRDIKKSKAEKLKAWGEKEHDLKEWGQKEVSLEPLRKFSEKRKAKRKEARAKKLGELKEKREHQHEKAKMRIEALGEKAEIKAIKKEIRGDRYAPVISKAKDVSKEARRVGTGIGLAIEASKDRQRDEGFFDMSSGKGGAIDWDAKKSDSGMSLTIGHGKGTGGSVLGGGGKFGLAIGGGKGTGGSVLGGGGKGLSLFAREPVRKRKKASKSKKPKSKPKPRKSGVKSRRPSKKRKSRTKKRRGKK